MAKLVQSIDAFVRGCYTDTIILLGAPKMDRLIPCEQNFKDGAKGSTAVILVNDIRKHNDIDIGTITTIIPAPLYLPVTTRELD